jgi:hypothetical protein
MPQVPADAGRRPSRVEQRVRDSRDSLPGERDALPPGSLPIPTTEPHGDENREPGKPPVPPPRR